MATDPEDEWTFANIWRETWTRDNLGHLVLFIKWSLLAELPMIWLTMLGQVDAFAFSPAALPGPICGAVAVFLRELTQVQATQFDHNYLRGWPGDRYDGPEKKAVWRPHKAMEAIAPITGGCGIKALLIAVI